MNLPLASLHGLAARDGAAVPATRLNADRASTNFFMASSLRQWAFSSKRSRANAKWQQHYKEEIERRALLFIARQRLGGLWPFGAIEREIRDEPLGRTARPGCR